MDAKKGAIAAAPDPYKNSAPYVDKVLGIQGGGVKDLPSVAHDAAGLNSTAETLRKYNSDYGLCSENALGNQWYLNNKVDVDSVTRAKMDSILKNPLLSQNQKIESQYDILKDKYAGSDPKKWENIQKDRKEIDGSFSKTKKAPQGSKKGNNIVASCKKEGTYCVKPNERAKVKPEKKFSDDLNKKIDKLKADREVIAAEKKAGRLADKAKIASDKAAASFKAADNAALKAWEAKQAVEKVALPKGTPKNAPGAQAAIQVAATANTAVQHATKAATRAKASQKAATAAQRAATDATAKADAVKKMAEQATREWEQRAAGTVSGTPANALPQMDFVQLGEWEGSYSQAYIPWNDGQQNASGTTIGSGLDLGQQTPESLKAMGLSDALVKKLSPYCGKQRREACNFLTKNPLALTSEETKEVDEKMKAEYASRAEDQWNKKHAPPKFRDLDPAIQTVLLSRQVNAAKATSGSAMDAFNVAATKGDKAASASALRSLAEGLKEKKPSLRNRLNSEAKYLEK